MGSGGMTLYVDGAARGNPGPAGVAAILVDTDGREVFAARDFIGEATNNVAEYRALILGLSEAAAFTKRVRVCCDSELVVRQVNGEYKVRSPQLKELIERVRLAASSFSSIEVLHVPRERNARADAVANEAIDEYLEKGETMETGAGNAQERLFDV